MPDRSTSDLTLQIKRRVKRGLLSLFKFFLFLQVGIYFQLTRAWLPLYSSPHIACENPPLPGNRSGAKVLIAAFAKMGTRTMSRSLYELGLERSYHSEELALHVWSGLASRFWQQRGGGPPLGIPYVGRTLSDMDVLAATSPAELADAISRCRVDALAFDGMEELFWPMYEVSPNAKVLVLRWRSFDEVAASATAFNAWFSHFMYISVYLSSAMHALPWGSVLWALDPLAGSPIRRLLAEGGPPINQVQGPLVMLWYRAAAPFRVSNHWFHGLGAAKSNASFYGFLPDKGTLDSFFERINRDVPPERRLNFDPRKDSFEVLCRFLDLAECRRSGPLPRARGVYCHERDFPLSFAICVLVYVVLHWLNWQLFGLLLGAVLSGVTRTKTE